MRLKFLKIKVNLKSKNEQLSAPKRQPRRSMSILRDDSFKKSSLVNPMRSKSYVHEEEKAVKEKKLLISLSSNVKNALVDSSSDLL